MRTGRTSAMYWSAATIFNPTAVAAVVKNKRPVVRARAMIGSINFASRPNYSSNAPKLTAAMINQIVSPTPIFITTPATCMSVSAEMPNKRGT